MMQEGLTTAFEATAREVSQTSWADRKRALLHRQPRV